MTEQQYDVTGRPIEPGAAPPQARPALDPMERIAQDVAVMRAMLAVWMVLTAVGVLAGIVSFVLALDA
jgi:hypothetical protein